MLDAHRDGDQRLRLVGGVLVDGGVEEAVAGSIGRDIGFAGQVDAPGDTVVGWNGAANQHFRFFAESGDEGEVVAMALGAFLGRVVEQEGACRRGHEAVGPAQDLGQVLGQRDAEREARAGPPPFQETLKLELVEAVEIIRGHRAPRSRGRRAQPGIRR